jgi:hypothetical protein
MLALVNRAKIAALPIPKVKAGRMACCQVPHRATGKICSFRAKIQTSRGPKVMDGTETPSNAKNIQK